MQKLQILGTGCAKCNQLEQAVRDMATDLGLAAEIEKVSDIKDILAFKVMGTPALAIDGKVVTSGKVPSANELRELLGSES